MMRAASLLALVVLGACTSKSPAGALRAPSLELPEPLHYSFTLAAPEPERSGPRSHLVEVLSDELSRSVGVLAATDDPPYYASFQVVHQRSVDVSARFGAIVADDSDESRQLNVDIRLGDPRLDNTHPIHGDIADNTYRGAHPLPLTEDSSGELAVRNAIWLATEAEYEAARAALLRARASAEVEVPTDEPHFDFSAAPAAKFFEARPAPVTTPSELSRFRELVRELSALGRGEAAIQESGMSLSIEEETRTFVNTEGAEQELHYGRVRLDLSAGAVTSDGMSVGRSRAFHARTLAELPAREEIEAAFRQTLRDVAALVAAPAVEPYVGPALLEGRAAGVFLHEVLGHRVEGHRQQARNEGQTFAGRIGQQVMLPTLDIYDDPRLLQLGPYPLNGHYLFDDEGVAAGRATLVEAGVLKGFLMSRTPVLTFHDSNGHGRRQPGYAAVARQANLVAHPRAGLPAATLRERLIALTRARGLEYALRFEEIEGGYTQTQRGDAQAFKVLPVMVYRMFVDGHEELVRGVDIEGTPLLALSKVAHVGSELHVFNGMCGAESGWVPVSAVAPDMLITELEVARKEVGSERPPLLPPPVVSTSPRAMASLRPAVGRSPSPAGGPKL